MAEELSGRGLNTIIGKGSTVEGSLYVMNSLRIEGIVRGKVACTETITVGMDGMVEAEIQARGAVISGKVVGNIVVSERVELEANASVHGDIITSQIIINEGAFFHGNCEMNKKKDETPVETIVEKA